ncbi:uncharacterized protein K460DRAFT_369141 [Cucurbitaria berberidis CBS 394.84]|uniref:Uncharacterized protein n=1 Tax=Cucurbitaria berberidis CBS 394.84 TaxID=1168544 RepID=A0A9P4GF04_9PLEO|nr:uncharacterized protein K460DRAFT_369141 [Cucurbitaria berberidis CBS 394.84]KAF1844276.1 hypothetical protein K460DRAFT_369141 [Cucurbitaria berberidis CBS 394.84]
MQKTDELPKNAKLTRKYLLEQLCDPDIDDDCETGFYDHDCPETGAVATLTEDSGGPEALDASLEEVKAWLDTLCHKEKAQYDDLSAPECERLETETGNILETVFKRRDLGLDTKILERIRRGEGPRDVVIEDLLAPLRLDNNRKVNSVTETYDDQKAVLLAWNKHVTGKYDNTKGRELLVAALHERLKAISKVQEIIQDKRASEMYDRVGQEAILEPSAKRLLQALHAYRPETARFEYQDPLDMLVILWANTRPEIPDIKMDDEMKYLSLKVLAAESSLSQSYTNEAFRRETKKRRDSARQRQDKAEFLRLKQVQERSDRKAAKQSIQRSIDTILSARRELRKAVLYDLQELTVLQATQKLVATDTFETNPERTPHWTNLRNACVQADLALSRARLHHLEDLEASAEIASHNIQQMRNVHQKMLTRTLKLGGHDLDRVDEGKRRRIVEERKNEPVTARMMSETFNGVVESRLAARQMLRQVSLMEGSLEELLDVARTQYREYDALIRLIDGN